MTSAGSAFSVPSSKRANRLSSQRTPVFTASAVPSAKTSGGRVSRQSVPHSTAAGWRKAPARFFPAFRSMAVLPPTEESTAESIVVGICTYRMPRRYTAAAKPAMSPTTPPPRAMRQSERVNRSLARNSRMSDRVETFLLSSPAGNSKVLTA